ncbi:MAG: hypothetical protein JWM80_2312 [Cyanobacteria bacterium RYN_339]|nr:hypothetical protein [Cyanobacteria bacterium RYN_339]
MSLRIYTAGYEHDTQASFVAKLKAAGVTRVIDTRYLPSSRKKGLSKGPLSARLAEEGIDYIHLKEVGTPKPWRDEYKRDHDFQKLARRYGPYLEERGPALKQIFDLARERPSALVCYEASAEACHRSLVARRLGSIFGQVEVVDL